MDFERFKQINDTRMNYHEMEDADVISSYRNTGCGDGYRLYLKVSPSNQSTQVVTDASYTTTGCGFGLVSLAVAAEWLKGKTLEQAAQITAEDIENEFQFPPRRQNYPESAAQCVRKAIKDYRNGTGMDPSIQISGKKVLSILKSKGHLRGVDMSQVILEGENLGGVDFTNANLSHSFLNNCCLEKAIFFRARLRGAFLNNANLREADLREADIRWAKLTGADLEGVLLEDAIYDIGTRLDPNQTHRFDIMKKGVGDQGIYLRSK